MDAPNYENESEEAILLETFNNCSGELKVGMKVFSEDEAYNLYNEYALRNGFSIRRGNKRPDLNGILRQREYLCSKARYRKVGSINEVKEFNHLETRTDCKARIRFTIDNGIWTISHLNDDHNHELASPEERRNLRSGRKVLKAYGDVITSMVAAGIKPTQSYNYLSKEIGPDYVGFTKEDCYNYLHMGRENLIEAGDGQSVINFFKLIQYYEEKVEEMRRDERSDDFRCKNGAPPKVSKRGILNHASKVYTLVMFSKFEEELLDSFGLNCVEISCNGTTSIYHVTEDGRQRVHIVQFDLSNDEISCSCKLFEILGILCKHALRVLVMKNYKEIPEPYILKRWTRSAKSGIEGDVGESLNQEGKSTRSLRLSELNHMGRHVFDKGSLSRKCTEIVKDKLREALKMVEEEIANSDSVDDLNCVEEDITACVEEMPSPRPVLDPLRIRTKGSTNARIKSYWEKKKRKTRRVSEKPQMPHPNHMVTGQKRKSRIGDSQLSFPQASSSILINSVLQQLEVPMSANNYNQVNPTSVHDQFTIPTQLFV
ncbi:hypothetical protein RHMOL_Rhmol05G0242900 [Rhododendron molle]|uniref:Uncharacterized protein n=1 Tax=Rhododendron molle TaxID=49168 RepID=A0ACC0NSH6_RHOML|nr:hypothetical protein RHMOL_Rhmol05G0242900 [Rhododendron molle]